MSTITLGIYDPQTLTTAVNQYVQNLASEDQNVLSRQAFSVNPVVNLAPTLQFFVDKSGLAPSGYTLDGQSSTPVSKSGFSMRTLHIPKIRKHAALTQQDLMYFNRALVPNLPLTVQGADAYAQLRAALVQRNYERMVAMAKAQTEATAAQALATGSADIKDPDGNQIGTVDYNYTGDGSASGDNLTIQPTLTGDAKWDAAKSKPLTNLRALVRQIRRYTGHAGTFKVFAGYAACDALLNNDQILKLLFTPDNKMAIGSLNASASNGYRGSINGIDIYEYEYAWGLGSAARTEAWDSGTIAVVANFPAWFPIEFGPCFDYVNSAAEVPEPIMVPWFAKFDRENDPPMTKQIVETNQLPVIKNPQAVRVLKVV